MAEIKVLEQKGRASLDIRILIRDYLLRQHTVSLLRRQFEIGFPIGLPMETCISQSIPFVSGAEMSACPTPLYPSWSDPYLRTLRRHNVLGTFKSSKAVMKAT